MLEKLIVRFFSRFAKQSGSGCDGETLWYFFLIGPVTLSYRESVQRLDFAIHTIKVGGKPVARWGVDPYSPFINIMGVTLRSK